MTVPTATPPVPSKPGHDHDHPASSGHDHDRPGHTASGKAALLPTRDALPNLLDLLPHQQLGSLDHQHLGSLPQPPSLLPAQLDLGLSPAHDLERVREAVREDDRGKWDRLVPRRDLSWSAGRLVLPEAYAADVPQSLVPSPWATAQVCARLGIPARYFHACPPHLQESQFDWWKRYALAGNTTRDGDNSLVGEDGVSDEKSRHEPVDESERWLLRGKGQTLRGALSSRYVRLDNAQLIDCLLPVVDERFRVQWSAITEGSFHLRLVDPALSADALPGDRLMAGIHLGNSEIGRRSVSVDALVFRVLCANGLVRVVDGKGLLRQRHVSWDPPRFRERLSKAISAALLEGTAFLSRLTGRMRIVVPDMERALDTLSERWGLGLSLRQSVRMHLLASPPVQQETLWGLVNALTRSAQDLPPDARYDLESKAGWLAEHGTASELIGRRAGPTGVGSRSAPVGVGSANRHPALPPHGGANGAMDAETRDAETRDTGAMNAETVNGGAA